MFVNVYSCLWNAFCFDSIRFEGIFNLNALSVRWSLGLVRPTLDAAKTAANILIFIFAFFPLQKCFIHYIMIYPCHI